MSNGKPPEACATSLAAGARAGALRRERGWSQSRLGRLAGVSPGMVSFLETGVRNLTLPLAERVAKALGTTVAALAGDPAGPASLTAAGRVTALRGQLGRTTEELAGEAGIPPGTLSLMEAGRLDFTLDALEQVARALGTDVAGLLAGGAGSP